MEVKRAFRCYRGPDDPGPFSDIINAMSFHCRQMKEYNKRGVFSLTASTPIGEVTLQRINDVDYIWTKGKKGFIFIILIPDLITGWKIPVSLIKDKYEFMPMLDVDDIKNVIARYEFEEDVTGLAGDFPRFEYMPYISKRYGISHTSVGHPGNIAFLSPFYGWHYKHYILDCTGNAGSDDIWRPPYQTSYYAFGADLHPPWYSMSDLTDHGFHYCFEAAIDQLKRIYQPINVVVTLDSEEITVADFTLLSREGLTYNFVYPVRTDRFYGKNAFTYIKNSQGIYELTSFGESIHVNGAEAVTVPAGIDPILFFWPWVPYLDEVRGFNILSYAANTENPLTGSKWFLTPSLAPFYSWEAGGHDKQGQYSAQQLFKDDGSFSDVSYPYSSNTAQNDSPCSCGDCGTGDTTVTNLTDVPEYSSSGTRYVPIGLIGGRIPIRMKTTWSQTGRGPTTNNVNVQAIAGTYPFLTLQGPSIPRLDEVDLFKACCLDNFASTGSGTTAYSETANNNISITQELRVGDDLIFSGESTMSYSLTYSLNENYAGSIAATVTPPEFECDGAISYTTQQVPGGSSQSLSWVAAGPTLPACVDTRVFTWALSGGGSLSTTTEQTTIYTAPETNPNCENNATVSLLCNGVVVDTLEMAINVDTGGVIAYYNYTGYHRVELPGGYLCPGQVTYYSGQWGGCCVSYHYCDGTRRAIPESAEYACSCAGCTDEAARAFCEPCQEGVVDVRTSAQKANGCCPVALL